MPPEPKKPIEELLEASAQARRTEFGGDPKMPNPMRTRLQDEIASLARSRESEGRARWFGINWPRMVMGAAFASLVIGAFGLWWQTHQTPAASARLAMDQTAPARERDRLEAVARPAAPAVQPMLPAQSDKLEDSVASEAKNAVTESAPSASADGKALSLAQAAPVTQPSLQNFRQSASKPTTASAGMVARRKDEIAANLTQQFSQSAANKLLGSNAKLKRVAKILDNFQVEQNGHDFRVVDDDGSTYSGRIERLTANDTRNLPKEKQSYTDQTAGGATAGQAKAAEEAPQNEFYFRARGFNSSLQKSLVFEGNYIVTAPPPRKNLGAAGAKSDEQLPARIVGTAKVSGEPSIPVDAATVPSK